MFCPNCGKDCGDANFCSHCGTRIQQEVKAEAKSAVWSVGMPCPYCGGTKLEGNNCAFCGALLKEDDMVGQKTWQNLPLGTWECSGGYLKLKKKVIVLKNEYTPECTIPYELIVDTKYQKPSFSKFGWLSIRWQENAHVLLPASYFQAMYDETTVLYFNKDEDFFFGYTTQL